MGNNSSRQPNSKSLPDSTRLSLPDLQRLYVPVRCLTHGIPDNSLSCILHSSSNELYILKKMEFPTEIEFNAFMQDLDKLTKLEHDHILKIYHYAIQKIQVNKDSGPFFIVYIVMEHFEFTLQEEILNRTRTKQLYDEAEIKKLFNSLVDALEFLQLKNLSIGTLTTSKVFITQNKKPKLMLAGELERINARPRFFSSDEPLSALQKPIDEDLFRSGCLSSQAGNTWSSAIKSQFTSNVFSLGLIILELMTMNNPRLPQGDYTDSVRRKQKILKCYQSYRPYLCNLVRAMLKESERLRPDFLELKGMMLVEEYKETVQNKKSKRELRAPQLVKTLKNLARIQTEKRDSDTEASSRKTSICNTASSILILSEDVKESDDELLSKVLDSEGELKEGRDKLQLSQKSTGCVSDISDQEKDNGGFVVSFDEMIVKSESELREIYNRKVVTIRRLTIDFSNSTLSEDTGVILGEVIGQQVYLVELALNVPQCVVRNRGLQEICVAISQSSNLVSFTFDARNCEINDRHVEMLGDSIRKKQKLSHVALNLSDNYITKEGIGKIAGYLEEMRSIEKLALNLGGNRAENEGLGAIGRGLKGMKELRNLAIFLYNNQIDGKEGIARFLEGIKEMTSLEKLHLNLASNLLEDEEMTSLLGFAEESLIGRIVIDVRGNNVSREVRRKLKSECFKREYVSISV